LGSEVGLWSRVLTAGELTSLFNSGNGKKYADLTTAEKVDLVSYWNLDEASGTRKGYNAAGAETNNLTDNNTVGSATAVSGAMDGAAASFVLANSEYLDKAYDACGSGAWTVSGWMYNTDGDGANASTLFLSQDAVGTSGYRQTGLIRRGAFSNNWIAESGDATATYSGSLNAAWHFIVAWFDPVDSKTRISVDNATPIVSTTARTTTQVATTTRIGSTFGGLIDEVALWDRVLTADERTELWNAGAGKFHPFT
jgi:hypothetical protein